MQTTVIDEVTMYDDWSIWEACKMAALKGNELKVYSRFAAATAKRLSLAKTSSMRQFSHNHQIIDIVRDTNLSQTQVRYAMKKVIDKGLVRIKNPGSRPEYYVSYVDDCLAEVHRLVKRDADCEAKWKSMESGKSSILARIAKAEKVLRKAKRDVEKCKTYLELTEYDKGPRDFIGWNL